MLAQHHWGGLQPRPNRQSLQQFCLKDSVKMTAPNTKQVLEGSISCKPPYTIEVNGRLRATPTNTFLQLSYFVSQPHCTTFLQSSLLSA